MFDSRPAQVFPKAICSVLTLLPQIVDADRIKLRWNYKTYNINIRPEPTITDVIDQDTLKDSDDDPEAPLPKSYEPSQLRPDDDDERKIIEAYNRLIKEKYQRDVDKSRAEYQRTTFMIELIDPISSDSDAGSDESESESGTIESWCKELSRKKEVRDAMEIDCIDDCIYGYGFSTST